MQQDMSQTTQAPQGALLVRIFTNPYLLLALAGLFWAGNHISGRAAAGHLPPVSMAGVRWLIGAALLYPFVRKHLRHDAPLMLRHWKVVLGLSLIGGAMFNSLQYLALNYTVALNASIFNSFGPVAIVTAGAILFRDRFTYLQMLGIAISFTGVMTIVSRGDFTVLRTLTFNHGDLLLLLGMLLWAIYCACLRLLPKVHPLSFTFALALITGIVLSPFYVWDYMRGVWFQPTLLTFAIMGYVSVFSGILGYLCWSNGQEQIGPSRAAIFLHLIPIYGALLATAILGESLHLFHIAGFVLILTGVWFAARK